MLEEAFPASTLLLILPISTYPSEQMRDFHEKFIENQTDNK